MLSREELELPGDGSSSMSMAGGPHAHSHSGMDIVLDQSLSPTQSGIAQEAETSIER